MGYDKYLPVLINKTKKFFFDNSNRHQTKKVTKQVKTKSDKTGKTWNRTVCNIKFLLKIISLKSQLSFYNSRNFCFVSLNTTEQPLENLELFQIVLGFEKICAKGEHQIFLFKFLNFPSMYTNLQASLMPGCNMPTGKTSGSALNWERLLRGVWFVWRGFVCLLGFFIFGFFKIIAPCPGPPAATQPRQKSKGITPGCSTALMWPLNPGYLENGICLQKNVLITP